MNSGAMQKDFDDIIESGVMPPTLTGLLEGGLYAGALNGAGLSAASNMTLSRA